jgi:adenosine deaminase
MEFYNSKVDIFDYWVEVTVMAVGFSIVGGVIASGRPLKSRPSGRVRATPAHHPPRRGRRTLGIGRGYPPADRVRERGSRGGRLLRLAGRWEADRAGDRVLGVFAEASCLPLKQMLAAGVQLTLGADDPLPFGSSVADEYALCRREMGLSDEDLALIAGFSIEAAALPRKAKRRHAEGIDRWLRP